MFSAISSFQIEETPTPFFTNPNISLFPDDIFTDDNSSSLRQSTAPLDESPPTVEPTYSTSAIPSLSPVSPPPPLQRTCHVSQPSVIL